MDTIKIWERANLLWYLEELCEATETLSRRYGHKTPECLPYARIAIARAKGEGIITAIRRLKK